MAKRKENRRTSSRAHSSSTEPLLWNKQNYIWIAIGALCILVGLLLMMGGSMDSPDVWNADKIYSFRRVTLAPIVILAGLIIEIYAIFKKS